MKRPRPRTVLLNPGPVNVTERVRRALVACGDVCHREPEYRALAEEIRELLLRAFAPKKPRYEAVLLTGSGTAAVEAMVSSALPPGKKLLVVENGIYGERMRRMARAHGIPTASLVSDYFTPPDLAELDRRLARDAAIAAVALVHHETTTGLLNPVAAVARLVNRRGRFLILDAVSALGCEPLDLAATRVGLVAATANKAVQGLPGVAFVLVRADLLRRMAKYPPRSVYLHLPEYHRADALGTVPFTPAVPAAYALREALRELLEEGVARRIARVRAAAEFIRRGGFDLGLELPLAPALRANALTAFRLPEGVSYPALHDALKARGFVIYAGQGALARQIFRVANLGDLKRAELARFLTELGRALKRLRPPARTGPEPVRRAIILAAGRGKRLGALGASRPKCLLRVGGQTLLARHLELLKRVGVDEIGIVVGYRAAAVRREAARAARRLGGLRLVFRLNPRWRRGSLLSLHAARTLLDRPALLMDADVYYGARLLRRLVASPQPSAFLLDPRAAATGEEMMLVARGGRVREIARRPTVRADRLGEGVGFLKLDRRAARRLAVEADKLVHAGALDAEYEAAVQGLLGAAPIGYETVADLDWTEIDFPADLARAERELRPRLAAED